jgi:hypothetical protein
MAIEELVDGNRLAGLVTLGEVITLEHARHGVVGRETHHVGGGQRRQPARIEVDARALAVEDLEYLRLVGAGVVLDLGEGQRRARGIASGGIADHPGKVADQKGDLVPVLLELAHLVEQHRVPEMQVGRRRIEPRLDAQRRAALHFLRQLLLGEHLVRAALELCDLLLEIHLCPLIGRNRRDDFGGHHCVGRGQRAWLLPASLPRSPTAIVQIVALNVH